MVEFLRLSTSASIVSSSVIQQPLLAPDLFAPPFFLFNIATKMLFILLGLLIPLDSSSNLRDGLFLLSGKQSASGFAFLSNKVLVPRLTISPLASLKPLFGLKIVFSPMPDK